MTSYEELLDQAHGMGLSVHELPFHEHDGLIIGNRVGIRSTISTEAQKADVLCEELGHCLFSIGNILDQSIVENRKQERTARIWAYEQRIGLDKIIEAYMSGCRSRYDMAEYIGVHERFLDEALNYYHEKYGCSVERDGYNVCFEPKLVVYKMF